MTKPNLIFAILDRQETTDGLIHQRSIHDQEWPRMTTDDHARSKLTMNWALAKLVKIGRGGRKWPKLNFNWILEVLIIWYFWCLGF